MKFFTKHGYVTIMNDHRGHGKSVLSDEDLGYMNDENGEYIVEDLHQISEYVKNRFPGKELILFGHSMGSLVVRKYIKKYDSDINKLIVCGSPSINGAARIGVIVTKLFRSIKGPKYRSNFLNSLSGLPQGNYDWLSTDSEYVKQYSTDKYCGYVFTTNGFINLTNMLCDVYSKKGWVLNNPNLPILFIAGSDDPVIKSEKLYLKSINFLKNIGYNNIEYKLYDKMRHALMFEVNKKLIYDDLLEFVQK
jgi:alpha-beta hydrolase superfamily lysophospholipase